MQIYSELPTPTELEHPFSSEDERQQLLYEFWAWNELLGRIHEAELEALRVDDRVAFPCLHSLAQKANEARDSIAQALRRQAGSAGE